jgi:hypothetical protein
MIIQLLHITEQGSGFSLSMRGALRKKKGKNRRRISKDWVGFMTALRAALAA